MNTEQAMRRQHAQALLDGLHAERCAGVPVALLEQARRSALGRRHLARAAWRAAPTVFAPDHERWQAWIETEDWLHWPHTTLESFTHELGAVAFGPALRVAVERSEVLFLREAFGLDAWRRAQAADPWRGAAPEAVRHMGRAAMQRCERDAQALRDAVFERGKIEFLGHAGRSDARLAERLALAYASAPALPCIKECWLPAGTVAELLASSRESDEAGAAEAPPE